jgi:hypothetical protein
MKLYQPRTNTFAQLSVKRWFLTFVATYMSFHSWWCVCVCVCLISILNPKRNPNLTQYCLLKLVLARWPALLLIKFSHTKRRTYFEVQTFRICLNVVSFFTGNVHLRTLPYTVFSAYRDSKKSWAYVKKKYRWIDMNCRHTKPFSFPGSLNACIHYVENDVHYGTWTKQ